MQSETETWERLAMETCGICLEKTYGGSMLSLHDCIHKHCSHCAKKHMEVKLHGNCALPKCPQAGCNGSINMRECKRALRPKLAELLEQRWKESQIPVQDRLYCPYPRCSYLMSKTVVPGGRTRCLRTRCLKCVGEFCATCKVPWHYLLDCLEYKRLHPYSCADDEQLISLAKTLSWRRCIKCSHMIELSSGCNHVTCRCGYEFCYVCESEWHGSCGCRR